MCRLAHIVLPGSGMYVGPSGGRRCTLKRRNRESVSDVRSISARLRRRIVVAGVTVLSVLSLIYPASADPTPEDWATCNATPECVLWFDALAALDAFYDAVLLNTWYLALAAPAPGQALASYGGRLCYGPCAPAQYPCILPEHICWRESGNTINVKNKSSSASGKYQFIDGTWNGFGGYEHAGQAPELIQDEKAGLTWAGGAGSSHWAETL